MPGNVWKESTLNETNYKLSDNICLQLKVCYSESQTKSRSINHPERRFITSGLVSDEKLHSNSVLNSHHQHHRGAHTNTFQGADRKTTCQGCETQYVRGTGRPGRGPHIRVKRRIDRAVRSRVKVSHPGPSASVVVCPPRDPWMCALAHAEGNVQMSSG